MPRVAGPDPRLSEVEVAGRIHKRQPDGTFHLGPKAARLLVAEGGSVCSDAGPPVSRDVGYRCPDCTFRSYFKICSRCGGLCERDHAR
jgi:hypothetical protein